MARVVYYDCFIRCLHQKNRHSSAISYTIEATYIAAFSRVDRTTVVHRLSNGFEVFCGSSSSKNSSQQESLH